MPSMPPLPRTLSLAALLLLLSSSPRPVLAQTPEETFTDEIEVSLVNLEVVVTDKKGKPMAGLTREEFEVYEDGKLVEITNFFAESGPAATVEGKAETRPIDQRLNLVVFVDDYNTEQESRNAILDGVREFVSSSLSPGDQVMVVRFGRSLEVRKPFTSDRAEVISELEVIRKLASNLASRESSRDHQIEVVIDGIEATGGWGPVAEARIREYAEVETSYAAASLDALETVVGWLSGLPGRKAILYVSDGLPAVPGEDLFIWAEARSGYRAGNRISGMNAAAYDASELFRRVTSRASRNRVSIHAIEAMGARWVRGTRLQEARIQNRQNGLRFLAEETGGTTMLNAAQPGQALSQTLAPDLSTYYSLGYRPQRNADDREHKVEVKVKRKGTLARYRRWYQDKPVSEAIAERTAATMAFGAEDNPLGAALEIGPQTPAGEGFVVPLRVKIPIDKLYLEPKGTNREGRLRLFVVASGASSVTPVRETRVVTVTVPESDLVPGAAGKPREYVHEVRITLGKGSWTVGVGVRDEIATTTSYLQGKLESGSSGR